MSLDVFLSVKILHPILYDYDKKGEYILRGSFEGSKEEFHIWEVYFEGSASSAFTIGVKIDTIGIPLPYALSS